MPDIFAKEHELLQALYQNTNLQHICNKIEELTGTPSGWAIFLEQGGHVPRLPKDDLADMINRIEHLPVQQRERSMEKMFQWLQDRQPRLIELPYLRNCRMVWGCFIKTGCWPIWKPRMWAALMTSWTWSYSRPVPISWGWRFI